MAREKGMGTLQREKSGRYTVRVAVDGVRYSRSARTKDRCEAEAFLQRFLQPFGLGERTIPLSEVWREYEKSPNRKALAMVTMASKKIAWMCFAEWIEQNHMEITQLKLLTSDAVAEYLRAFRSSHTASTYNARVCVLREICRTLYPKAGVTDDPWEGVRLLPDDSHSRRELNMDELCRLMDAAERAGTEWKLLVCIGAYTGLRLGDCCSLEWTKVNMERGIIQVIPQKTKKHAHGRPITIPIHPNLCELLARQRREAKDSPFVLPGIAAWHFGPSWRVSQRLGKIFRDAGIVTSVKVAGRNIAAPDATFHSLRHTFVSFAANAGVPLPVVQSIVGHTSTAMTRHYYHENEDALRAAVAAIPTLEELHRVKSNAPKAAHSGVSGPASVKTVEQRLKGLERLFKKRLISEIEYNATRVRILAEI